MPYICYMATDLEQLQQDYNDLKRAIRTGTREVYYGDKRVVYRSLSEMQQILKGMELDLGISKPLDGRKFAQYDSGIHRECDNND